jgi:hypothetical protein
VKASKARAECKRMIIAAVGPGGYEAFLMTRQPALGDMTGEWLLKHEPNRLLERVRKLEREKREGIDDE